MSLEGFVRAAGAAMGMARESFGTGGGVALAPPPGLGSPPDGTGDGSGAAADGFSGDSSRVTNHVGALADHDAVGHSGLAAAITSSSASRGRMDAVIGAAIADVQASGVAVNTPAGQQALVAAIKRHLQETKSTLDQGSGDAATHAAAANVTAAGYQGIGNPQGGPAPMMPMMPQMPSLPMGGGMPLGGAMLAPLSSLSSLGSLLGGAGQGVSSGGSTVQGLGFGEGIAGSFDGGQRGDRIVKAALSQLGVPYSWGGGTVRGPGPGIGVDAGKIGFDCSGLVRYAYWQAGIELPRTTYDMANWGVRVPPGQAKPGDILLCNWGNGAYQHVQLVMNDHQTIEAPDRGLSVRIGHWPSGRFEIRRAG
ncbi:NlpC/P60 family protein [Mycobacterium avium]|uniref:NlpC/P60 family protein n=2 Tax=Mycobacterium avium TaxID=1764 RepID=UPI0011559224|nr:NlpC/P60 family protein [Mycobacterium avium]